MFIGIWAYLIMLQILSQMMMLMSFTLKDKTKLLLLKNFCYKAKWGFLMRNNTKLHLSINVFPF